MVEDNESLSGTKRKPLPSPENGVELEHDANGNEKRGVVSNQ